MSSLDVDLDIDNYNLDDLLDLFKIDSIDNEANIAKAKTIALKMHPDKSGLDKEYFLFFSKAYKVLYQLYIVQDKTRDNSKNSDYENYKETINKDNRIILDKITKKNNNPKEFNKWFNEEFEAMKLKDDYTDNGYGEWLHNNDNNDNKDLDIKCKNINDVHSSIQKKREKMYQLAKHTEILDYNDSGYCDIGNNIPDNYSSGMFSSLAYQDLKQAHTETIIPVNEEDALIKHNNLDSIKQERGMKIQPITEEESNTILNKKKYMENKNDTNRIYKLMKQQEEVERNNIEWWKRHKLLK